MVHSKQLERIRGLEWELRTLRGYRKEILSGEFYRKERIAREREVAARVKEVANALMYNVPLTPATGEICKCKNQETPHCKMRIGSLDVLLCPYTIVLRLLRIRISGGDLKHYESLTPKQLLEKCML